jgi:hypothetical protein
MGLRVEHFFPASEENLDCPEDGAASKHVVSGSVRLNPVGRVGNGSRPTDFHFGTLETFSHVQVG